jgi:hypothetical protein
LSTRCNLILLLRESFGLFDEQLRVIVAAMHRPRVLHAGLLGCYTIEHFLRACNLPRAEVVYASSFRILSVSQSYRLSLGKANKEGWVRQQPQVFSVSTGLYKPNN